VAEDDQLVGVELAQLEQFHGRQGYARRAARVVTKVARPYAFGGIFISL
jgi:hypothetical protein